MKLWLEVYVEPCPPHTGLYVAQEVAKYPSGRVETTYLASAPDRYGIMNEINALPSHFMNVIPIISQRRRRSSDYKNSA